MPDLITELLMKLWDILFMAIGVGIGTGIGVPIGNKIMKKLERHQDAILDQAKRLVPNGNQRQEIEYNTPKSFSNEQVKR
jgi:hypothetical protein